MVVKYTYPLVVDIYLILRESCKPYGCLNVNLDESDELGTFIFSTIDVNSIWTLVAMLSLLLPSIQYQIMEGYGAGYC